MSALTVSKEDEARVKGMGFLNNQRNRPFFRPCPYRKRQSNRRTAPLHGRSSREVRQRQPSIHHQTFRGNSGDSL